MGKIYVDGREIQEYEHRYFHRKISMVGQEPILFNRSIRDNILYASEDESDQLRMLKAAREANVDGFINELAEGYRTKCGQRGGHLSGKNFLCSIIESIETI